MSQPPETLEADTTDIEEMVRARYTMLLVFLTAWLLAAGVLSRFELGLPLTVAVQAAALIFALRISGAARREFFAAIVVGVLATAAAAVWIGGTGPLRGTVPFLLGALLAAAVPVVIVRHISQHFRVTGEAVAGALCIYISMGIVFAYLFLAIEAASGTMFAQSTAQPDLVSYVYFSFITLTSTGYGDLTPGNDLARMLSVIEALIGQIYLVTVIALLIGNLGREGTRQRLRR